MTKFELAQYIINKYPGQISPMKLQKLVYYCYVWQLVAGQKQFTAEFKAWDYGPVDKELYDAYKSYGKQTIPADPNADLSNVDPLFDFIIDSYAVYSAIELSKTTHIEKPWKQYKDSTEPIPDETLKEFYSKQPFKLNFPLDKDNQTQSKDGYYYPPKTSAHYTFTFDMEEDYVPVFDSLEEYLKAFKESRKQFKELMHNAFEN